MKSKKRLPGQGEKRRSICPIACTLDIIGDKWTLLVVRDLMSGKSHFKEFLTSPESIATNILADRLTRLVSNGLVERYPSNGIAGKDAYRLTEKGHSLRSLMGQIKAWGLAHIEGTEVRVRVIAQEAEVRQPRP
ncbi:MAG TPA: helix-turn-helix domain-containing protein [Steroidobacteraceae bacterium]|nr:helix-turn-helix domain-containing protein [Steroidobacteraceae bacterium]